MKCALTTHYRSLSGICQDLQTPFSRVSAVIERLGIRPTVTIDTSALYDAGAVELIHDDLMRHKPEPVANRRVRRPRVLVNAVGPNGRPAAMCAR